MIRKRSGRARKRRRRRRRRREELGSTWWANVVGCSLDCNARNVPNPLHVLRQKNRLLLQEAPMQGVPAGQHGLQVMSVKRAGARAADLSWHIGG